MAGGPFGDLLWGLRPLHCLLHVLRPVTSWNLMSVFKMSAPHLSTFGAEKTLLLLLAFPETKIYKLIKLRNSMEIIFEYIKD